MWYDEPTIIFSNVIQIMLWKHIFLGQFSDGHWEGTPGWETWANMEAGIGYPVGVYGEHEVAYYDLMELVDDGLLLGRFMFLSNLAALAPMAFRAERLPASVELYWMMSPEEREELELKHGVKPRVIEQIEHNPIITPAEMRWQVENMNKIMRTPIEITGRRID